MLCVDKLSHLIQHVINNGEWKALKVGRHSPAVSHLMFVDDILLFGEATTKQIHCVKQTLNIFCNMSEQEVSQNKTRIFFPKNVNNTLRNQLVHISGFGPSSSLGKYLGILFKGKAPKKEDYRHIIDQVKSKLTPWKGKHLAFTGRVTLAKSVMEAMPIYPMLTNIIPKSCINKIQCLQREFIWGDNNNGKKYHAVKLSNIVNQKSLMVLD